MKDKHAALLLGILFLIAVVVLTVTDPRIPERPPNEELGHESR
jgi:hypothetical protein